jgi:ectoine hydroxylase-related dioxygenase (phytanoyl-CoA dioxygenase family)
MTDEEAGVVDSLRRDGFAVWPDFASGDVLDRLSAAVRRTLVGEHARRFPKSTRVFDLHLRSGAFVELVSDVRLAAVLDGVLGPGHLLSDLSLNSVGAGQPVDDWHIDYPFTEMHTMLPGGILALQCVLAMTVFTRANGATRLRPGTHHHPRPPAEVSDEPVLFEAAPGTMLLMAAATWHRSGRNAGPHRRDAILLNFVERWIKPMSAPTEGLTDPVPDRLASLLGIVRPVETINGVPI